VAHPISAAIGGDYRRDYAVTPQMVQHVAGRYLAIDQSAVVVVGPSPSGGAVLKPSAERVVR
jgi:hypothetical protein